MINPNDVLRFIQTAEQADPNPANRNLYKKLIQEEYDELLEAIAKLEFTDDGDESHILNEAMDLIWVIIGYCHVKGYDISGAWNELTRANLAKLQIDPITGHLLRRPDGKIKKPENWTAPNFVPYVGGQHE